jgi:hypothetical protein
VGDSPQCLAAQLSPADMNYFFADRQRYGFNTLWVDLICGPYTGGRANYSTYDGIVPFTTPGDLSTPNPAYFARIDTMVHLAGAHGITLLAQPADTGSFRDLLRANGTTKAYNYGVFLGARYRTTPNLIWLSGNDYQTDQWATYDPYATALARGLRVADPHRLQSVELNYPVSLSSDNPNWDSLTDLNAAYTYTPTYAEVLAGYNHSPARPVFMIEANYEGEHNTGGPPADGAILRRQEYWTMLSGATGQLYGNHYTWGFQDGPWKPRLDTVGAAQVTIMARFFGSLPWYQLIPDQTHTLLVASYGTPNNAGLVSANDYATASLTTDHTIGVLYLPTSRTITVDLTQFRAPVNARWFDPTDGSYSPAASEPLPNTGTHQFTPNRTNHQGDPDWVLLLTTNTAAPIP